MNASLASGRQLGANLRQHREVVGRLELIDQKECGSVALSQHILELERAIGGVDVDEHRADAGRGELQQNPLGDVGCPECDMLARLNAETDKTASGRIDI